MKRTNLTFILVVVEFSLLEMFVQECRNNGVFFPTQTLVEKCLFNININSKGLKFICHSRLMLTIVVYWYVSINSPHYHASMIYRASYPGKYL